MPAREPGGSYGENASQAEQTGDLLARAGRCTSKCRSSTGITITRGHSESKRERDLNKLDIRMPQPKLHTDIPRLRAGDRRSVLVGIRPRRHAGSRAVRATLEQIDVVHRMVRKYPDTFELARTAADVERIFKQAGLPLSSAWKGGTRSTTRSRRSACSKQRAPDT